MSEKINTHLVTEVTEVTEGNTASLCIMLTKPGVHLGEELADLLEKRYDTACTCEHVRGTVAQTFVDVVFAGGRKESYRLDNYVYYDRTK